MSVTNSSKRGCTRADACQLPCLPPGLHPDHTSLCPWAHEGSTKSWYTNIWDVATHSHYPTGSRISRSCKTHQKAGHGSSSHPLARSSRPSSSAHPPAQAQHQADVKGQVDYVLHGPCQQGRPAHQSSVAGLSYMRVNACRPWCSLWWRACFPCPAVQATCKRSSTEEHGAWLPRQGRLQTANPCPLSRSDCAARWDLPASANLPLPATAAA